MLCLLLFYAEHFEWITLLRDVSVSYRLVDNCPQVLHVFGYGVDMHALGLKPSVELGNKRHIEVIPRCASAEFLDAVDGVLHVALGGF